MRKMGQEGKSTDTDCAIVRFIPGLGPTMTMWK